MRRIPYVRGSETSKAAAEAKRRNVETHRLRVLNAIAQAGGATADEIVVRTGMQSNDVTARIDGLIKEGVVCASGYKRPTRTGCKANIYILGRGQPNVGSKNKRISRPSPELLIGAAMMLEGREVPGINQLIVAQWLRAIVAPMIPS